MTKERRKCSIEGCGRVHSALGYCQVHRKRLKAGADMHAPIGLRRAPGTVCEVAGCDRPHCAKGMCNMHWSRSKAGIALDSPLPGAGSIDRKGYRRLFRPGHPNAWVTGIVLEHIFVMSEILGRPLSPGENVHHKNGDRADNHPANLELWSTSQPRGQRVSDKVAWAKEILATYGDDFR